MVVVGKKVGILTGLLVAASLVMTEAATHRMGGVLVGKVMGVASAALELGAKAQVWATAVQTEPVRRTEVSSQTKSVAVAFKRRHHF